MLASAERAKDGKSQDQHDHEHRQEQEEQEFRDSDGRAGDSGEPEETGNEADNQKDEGPAQHLVSLLKSTLGKRAARKGCSPQHSPPKSMGLGGECRANAKEAGAYQ